MEKEGIYKLNIDCGRHGSLEGVFISTDEKVKNIIGTEIYWGEVLGKHSEVYGELEENEVIFVTDDEQTVSLFKKFELSSGFNPFHFLDE